MIDILASLLMLPVYLQLQDFQTNPLTLELTVTLRAEQAAPACPSCQTPAHRVHSHYERTLADLPWGEYRVCWKFTVRKCFCRNAECEQQIFSERFVEFIKPWARKTDRLMEHLVALGLALAGAAGARLTSRLNLVASRETFEVTPKTWTEARESKLKFKRERGHGEKAPNLQQRVQGQSGTRSAQRQALTQRG